MPNNLLNLAAAILLSVGIIFGWQYFYEKPRLEKLTAEHKIYNRQLEVAKDQNIKTDLVKSRQAVIASSDRITIKTESLSGSIALKGLRFDDLTLVKYKQTVSANSDPVELFSPSTSGQAYFAEIGWFSKTTKDLPNSNTLWQSDSDELTPSKPINLSWKNSKNIRFNIEIAIDNDYLFTIKQSTINESDSDINIQYYGLINRSYASKEKSVNILHQGPIGTIDGRLQESTYDNVKDKKNIKYTQTTVDWLGITDKYWLSAFIPDKALKYSANYSYAIQGTGERFQTDFISSNNTIEAGKSSYLVHYLFAGAKKVNLLDHYEKGVKIKLFDRAIDFGWFYIITKPVFYTLNFIYKYVGNFGISILIVTVLVKLAMFTLTNKSFRSMKKMKLLQPEMERLKALYASDKMRMNQEIMLLYKKEKVNPVSGCLPLLLQIPVFFSLYKVLYVTIEMRHAPFFGWIKDLSAPDPTCLINLFGILPFTPPSFLFIGIWPVIMAATMYLQQKMSPPPSDPAQAQIMKLMPLMFLFMFNGFPVGLLIYWSWNNVLSIVQQYYINKSK